MRCRKCLEEKRAEDFYSYFPGRCRSCIIFASKAWYFSHKVLLTRSLRAPEERRLVQIKYAKQWRINNRDRLLREYREKHPPKTKGIKKQKLKHYFRGQFVGPPEPLPNPCIIFLLIVAGQNLRRRHIRDLQRAWLARNPHIRKVRNQHKARKKKERRKRFVRTLFEQQNGVCVYCWKSLEIGYHVDHIMPMALGGLDREDNLQLLCPTCNIRKGAIHPLFFACRIVPGSATGGAQTDGAPRIVSVTTPTNVNT